MTRFARLIPMLIAFGLALGLVAGAVVLINSNQLSIIGSIYEGGLEVRAVLQSASILGA